MSMSRLAQALAETTGLDPATLGRGALERAVAACGHPPGPEGPEEATLAAYADAVLGDARVRAELVDELLVHETSFFRYPASLAAAAARLRARLDAGAPRVRVLSAPCSTGQEPASVVMALLEAGVDTGRVDLDAVDLSPRVVARARAGLYSPLDLRGLDDARRARFLLPEPGGLRLVPAVLAPTRFMTADLLRAEASLGGAPYDVVLCRNLLIYLTQEARLRLLETLERLLRPDGLLLLGHAEVPAARAVGFRPAPPPDAYAVRPPAGAAPLPPTPWSAAAPRPPAPPRVASARPNPAPPSTTRPSPALSSTAPAPPPIPASGAREDGAGGRDLEHARALLDAGRAEEALTALHAVEPARPSGPEAFHLRAVAARALGRGDDADLALTRALYLDPEHVPSLRLAALVARERGEHERAERLTARATRAEARQRSLPT